MGNRIRGALLLCLMAAAFYTARSAYQTIHPAWENNFPGDLYQALLTASEHAEYMLRGQGRYVAVYRTGQNAELERITAIELSTLRPADRAMLEKGIPAADLQQMLQLLEDLGS